MTELFNNMRKRLGIKAGANIVVPIRDYNNFDPDDNGNLTLSIKIKLYILRISKRVYYHLQILEN